MTEEKTVYSVEDAREAIAKEKEARKQKCIDEVKKILTAHRCHIDTIQIFVNGQIVNAAWDVVPED